MPGILIQTDDKAHFSTMMVRIMNIIDFNDQDLSIQIDGDGFSDYSIQGPDSAELLDQIKFVNPTPTPFTANNNSAALHNVANHQSVSDLQQSPPSLNSILGAGSDLGSGAPLETSEDCAQEPPNFHNFQPGSDRDWLLGKVHGWELDFRKNFPNDQDNLTAARYYLVSMILALLETPEALERSELYRQRMAAISTASSGYYRGESLGKTEYGSPALADVVSLYNSYDKYYKMAEDLKKSGHPIEVVADAFIDRDRDQAVNGIEWYREQYMRQREQYVQLHQKYEQTAARLAGMAAQLDQFIELAKKHGWDSNKYDAAVDQISFWLDLFVDLTNQHHKLGQQWETQKGSLQCLQELVDDKDKTIAKLTDRIQRADSRIIKLKNLL